MGLFAARAPARWGTLLALLVPLATSGCGGSGNVTGTVSYNGKLLRGGNVTFVSAAGNRSVSASIQDDGTYTLTHVPAGPVTVCVETESQKQAAGAVRHYKAPPGQQAPIGLEDTPESKHYTPIPEKFSKPEESGQSYTVKSGSQTYDIKLPP